MTTLFTQCHYSYHGTERANCLPTPIPLSVSIEPLAKGAAEKNTTFPASLAAMCGQCTKFWLIKCKLFAPPFFSLQHDKMTGSPAVIFNHEVTLG